MKQITLSKRMKKMLRELDGKLHTSKYCLMVNIIGRVKYENEIRSYCNDFEIMVNKMYEFHLLTDNDTRFGNDINVLHVIGRMENMYLYDKEMDIEII